MEKKRNDLTKAGHKDLPASVGLVKKVRDELRADIAGIQHELKSVEHRLEAKIERVLASTHRTEVLMEEQRSENKIVMDAFQQITAQYHRIEEGLLQRS